MANVHQKQRHEAQPEYLPVSIRSTVRVEELQPADVKLNVADTVNMKVDVRETGGSLNHAKRRGGKLSVNDRVIRTVKFAVR